VTSAVPTPVNIVAIIPPRENPKQA